MERKLWELLAANVLILALIILAAIVSGWGEALAWLGGLLAMDVRIVSRWVDVRWRDGGDSHPGEASSRRRADEGGGEELIERAKGESKPLGRSPHGGGRRTGAFDKSR